MRYRTLVTLALVASVVGTQVPAQGTAGQTQPALSVGERIAIARLREARAAGDGFTNPNVPDFDPAHYPSVIYEPGEWAVAAGFMQAPPGFAAIEGVEVAGKPVWRAPDGTFVPPKTGRRSPARLWGEWAVIAEISAPQVLLSEDHTGRISGEEWLSGFLADGYMLYLMRQRKAETPYVAAPVVWPDSAELAALSALQQRLIMRSGRMHVTEKNVADWYALLAQLVAVTHERRRVLGPQLTAREHAVELTDGVRHWVVTLLPRLGLLGGFERTPIHESDPTFHGYADSPVLRSALSYETLIAFPDSPASSRRQIATRAGEIINLIEMLKLWSWRVDLVAGIRPLIDQVGDRISYKIEEEPAHLQKGKADNGYDLALSLAASDLEVLRRGREALLATTFPPGKERLEIQLASPVTWTGPPEGSSWLGEGRWLVTSELSLDTPALRLRKTAQGSPVLVREGDRPGTVSGLLLVIPPGQQPTQKTASRFSATPAGLEVSLTGGSLSIGPDGTGRLSLP